MNTKNNVILRLDKIVNLLKSIKKDRSLALDREQLRAEVFALEGIFRLVLKQYKDSEHLAKHLSVIKNIEDQVGKYSFMVEIEQIVNKLFTNKKPNKMSKEAKHSVVSAEDMLMQRMTREKWIEQIEEMKMFSQDYKWPKKTKKFLKSALKNEIKKINSKIKEQLLPVISQPQYNHTQLEEGLHELRRSIRWVSIYIQAYKDKFVLVSSKKKKNSYEKSLIKKHKDSPFSNFTGDKNQIKLNDLAYYDLSEMIKALGDLKSLGEQGYFIEERWGKEHDYFDQSIESKSLSLTQHLIDSNILGNLL